jgi:hypothetical protein
MTLLPISQKQLKSLLKPQAGSLSARGRAKTPERARSRSRSRSKSKGKTVRPKMRSAAFRKSFAKSSIVKLKPLVEKKELVGKTVALAKSGYFADKDTKTVDLKTTQGEYDNLVKEIKLAIGAIRAGLGDRPIRIRLSQTYTLTATVTTGVVNTTVSVLPSNATEWSTCAALFEEYKCLGGSVNFMYANYTSKPSTGGAVDTNGYPVIGYDADDATAATSSLVLTQLAQHEVLSPMIFCSGVGIAAPACGLHHKFHFHIPKGTVESGSISIVAGTEWLPVQGVVSAGTVKFYHVGTEVTAVNVTCGVLYYDLEFRCRA